MILVVDDNPDICEVMEILLSRTGIPARCMSDPRAALEVLNTSPPPAAVVLDNHMPGLSGIEVLKIIRSKPNLQAMPVVMLSADADPRVIDECRRLGAQEYFVKSQFKYPVLIEKLRALAAGAAG